MSQKITKATSSLRSNTTAQRRAAIIDAALEEFVEKGFASARMDDIAQRAGVAKGTIYLNFSDKEALFQAILQREMQPNVNAAESLVATGGSLHEFVSTTLLPLINDLVSTRRGAVLRLLISEAGRFPQLAEAYYRTVLEPGLTSFSQLIHRARERGELPNNLLVEFPHLLIAPMLLGLLWSELFERFRHLDTEGMAHAYFEQLLGIRSID